MFKQNLVCHLTFLFAIFHTLNGFNYNFHPKRTLLRSVTETDTPSIDSDQIIEGTRGKRISMRCNVKNVKNYKIAWYFNGIFLTLDNIRIRNDKRISIENPQPDEWRLIIDSIDSADEGYYSCRLTNGLKKLMYLKVGVPPTFTGSNNGNHVIVNTVMGENVTLSCEADGNPMPVIYWYLKKKLVATGPHLHLSNISQFAHSEYECVARNNILPDPSRKFKINVHFKAELNVMYSLLYDSKRGELHLLCEIAGNPIHSIAWYKDDEEIYDDSFNEVIMLHNRNNQDLVNKEKHTSIHTTHLSLHKFVSKLKIIDVNKSNNGVYKCVVNGFQGNVSKEVEISEISEVSAESYQKTTSYKEISFESNFLGSRGARSNLTKLDEGFTRNLSAESSSNRIQKVTYRLLFSYLMFLYFFLTIIDSKFL